ncbi:MAG: HDOD domain-containing protein [Phycisphaerae bacterium]|nr:HDOD domain-containing protein [Phycisphaerae bacterium]
MAEAVETSPELVLSHLDSLPTLPVVAVKLLQVTVLDDTSASDVIRLLRADQSLTAKILSVAGSAALGVRGPVTTLERAVPLLGFSAVRSIVLATSVFDCFGKRGADSPLAAFDRVEFWKHALAVACASRRLARARRELGIDPEAAFVAGLLHDLGKVALDTVFPKAYDRIAAQANHSRGDIADHERTILGADHTVAGRRLAERWRLPRDLQESIWLHHLAADALPASVTCPWLIGIVQLADTVAREQRIGYSGNHVFYELSPRLAERLGFTTDQVADVVDALATDVAEHATLLGLGGETPQAVYVKAMTRANAELGRLNADLLAGNRRLAAGARYFKAITHFEQHLSDWADPLAVVVALAEAAAAALQRPRVAAFGLRDHQSAVDLCWTGERPEERGHTTQAVPAEVGAWLEEARGRIDALLFQAPPEIRTLLAAAMGPADRGVPWLLPIFHHGEMAGGVVYLSEGDERARLAEEADELRSFLASLGLALGRANAQAAAQRLSEDLAETNRRLQQMQVELLRSRTLSMIAEMAAGAGHELNTPLSVISGRAQMLATTLHDPEAARVLQMISSKAHECSGIVSELMDFARPRPPKLAPVNIAELLAEVRGDWLQTSHMPPSQLRLDLAGGTVAAAPLVLVDREQLKTVFRELIANAADAVAANNGTIVLHFQPALPDDTLEVLVQDAGCGMTPAVLQRAFDPFFSHRAAGRGRGLGLPRAYRIVEAHGGRIWLESQPDDGTTVHVLLPRARPLDASN